MTPEKKKIYDTTWRETHKEEIKESSKKYREANREKVKKSNMIWRNKNREVYLEKREIWQKEHPEYNKTYYKEHAEEAKTRAKKWRNEHPERVYARNREWVKANPEWVKERHKIWEKANPEKLKTHRVRSKAKRRKLGYNYLNEPFEYSIGHHINKDDVIHIPKIFHLPGHALKRPDSMIRINKLALFYLNHSKMDKIEDFLALSKLGDE